MASSCICKLKKQSSMISSLIHRLTYSHRAKSSFTRNFDSSSYFVSVQPSPRLHIGNYFCALRPIVQLQKSNERTVISIADLQSLVNLPSREEQQQNIFSLLALLVACGVDPNKCLIYQQSHVPQHQQLLWLMHCLSDKSMLDNMESHSKATATQKELKLGKYISPLLLMSDILVQKCQYIPTGRSLYETIDTAQQCAKVLNDCCGYEHFLTPHAWLNDYPYDILSLKKPSEKMSKSDVSEKNRINMLDSPEVIIEKCKKAVTDFDSKVHFDIQNRPGVSNLMAIHSLVTGKIFDSISLECTGMETAEYKIVVANALIEYLEPIQCRYNAILEDKEYLSAVLTIGNVSARESAELTLKKVYPAIGFNSSSEMGTSVTIDNYNDKHALTKKGKSIFSGIQPTGVLHLGNYFGAVRQWVKLMEDGNDVMVCIVDQHAVTVPQDRDVLCSSILNLAAMLIACGIDPERCILFQQSRVPEHSQLYTILSNFTLTALLSRQPQYRDKVLSLKDFSPTLGLYCYPVLQAADILLYKATHVPVGEDQRTHIDLTRNIAERFNKLYGNVFWKPKPMIPEARSVGRLRSLCDPTKKMSKSDVNANSRIEVLDSSELIVEKIRHANIGCNDSHINIKNIDDLPGLSSLIAMHSMISGVDDGRLDGRNIQEFKEEVAEMIVEHLKPIRQKSLQLMNDKASVQMLLDEGARKAKIRAEVTMTAVHDKLGLSL